MTKTYYILTPPAPAWACDGTNSLASADNFAEDENDAIV